MSDMRRSLGVPPAAARGGSRARPLRGAAAGLAGAVLLAGCSGGSGTPGPTPSAGRIGSVSNGLQQDYESVVRNVLPSVVQITTAQSLGSGIVYDGKGDIVTNAHVVGDARTFKVTPAAGTKTLDAVLVGSFPADDLAVIRLKNPPSGLHPATFGDSSKVEVGQIALAMGNPLGLSSSVTEGIVSAVGRTVSEGSEGGSAGATISNMVQTSASINPGNSGGALVNLAGQVIGIPTLAATDPNLGNSTAPGIGFAIPASTVTRIAGQLVRDGRVTSSGKAALGVTARTVLGANLKPAGAAVVSVTRGGAADRAGLAEGDVITGVDGTAISTVGSLSQTLASYSPGDRVRVRYLRDGATKTAQVTLGQL